MFTMFEGVAMPVCNKYINNEVLVLKRSCSTTSIFPNAFSFGSSAHPWMNSCSVFPSKYFKSDEVQKNGNRIRGVPAYTFLFVISWRKWLTLLEKQRLYLRRRCLRNDDNFGLETAAFTTRTTTNDCKNNNEETTNRDACNGSSVDITTVIFIRCKA